MTVIYTQSNDNWMLMTVIYTQSNDNRMFMTVIYSQTISFTFAYSQHKCYQSLSATFMSPVRSRSISKCRALSSRHVHVW